MTTPRQDSLAIWQSGVDALSASALIESAVTVESNQLWICDESFSKDDFDRVLIVGAGKATAAMAKGLIQAIDRWLPVEGWINVPEGTEVEIPGIRCHPARPAGVNEPRSEGVIGTKRILELVRSATARDLCITLLAGGGSALMPAPLAGISLDDKLAVIRFLSSHGADITELNTVRKHLSEVKGGGLLRPCNAGRLVSLVISDVLGDPLDLIASGPTVEDTSTQQDALRIMLQFDPPRSLPENVYAVLESDPTPRIQPTTRSTTIVLGNNAVAVDAAGVCAERLGYNHVMHAATSPEGPAEIVGRKHAEMLLAMLDRSMGHQSDCLITGGEPVVTLAPLDRRGKGGRNQQLVLAAYQALRQANLSEDQWNAIAMLSGGTDGEDGPTDAAGAILDGSVHRMALERSLDVDDFLSRNDAYRFFDQCGGLIKTGPTGTNVCDVRVVLVKPIDAKVSPQRFSGATR